MHKFMRSIGFSNFMDRDKLGKLLTDVIVNADERGYTVNEENIMLGEFSQFFGDRIGITVCGEFTEDEKFVYDYYYPYFRGEEVTSTEDITVERHAAKESYAGICDDMNVEMPIIFYLQNRIPYVRAQTAGQLPIRGTTMTLTGLASSGTILLPIQKNEVQIEKVKNQTAERHKLINAARQGDEDAMETLTLGDIDLYSSISRRIQREDIFSMVDTYFMPYGVECDQYSVLGEILDVKQVTNSVTGEKIYLLKICSNELTFDVCINIMDLLGEPEAGRRFKGNIWAQGRINFPEQ